MPSPLLNAVRNTASPAVLDAAHDVLKVSRLLSLPGLAARKLRPAHFQVLVTTLCYRLIAICPVAAAASPRGLDHPVAAAVHLALLSYMTTFFITLGRYRLTPYDLLAARLRDALDDPGFKRSVDPATHLWILVVGGISVLDGDADWLRPRVVAAADAFGTTDWRFARRLLSKYPWIGDLHDQPGSGFWTKCFSETLSKH